MRRMLRRAFILCCALLAPLAGQGQAAEGWAGEYVGIGGAASRMQITPQGTGRIEIRWAGGGDDRAGASTAAGCIAVASAPVEASTATSVRAELQPFRQGEAELDAADLAALKPGPIVLTKLDAAAVLVRVDGGFPHCGLQASLNGPYWRPAAASATPHSLSADFQRCTASPPGCAAAEHGRQDRRLNEGYQALLARLGTTTRARLRQVQRDWLAQRERLCAVPADRTACLASASARRADEFEAVERAIREAR